MILDKEGAYISLDLPPSPGQGPDYFYVFLILCLLPAWGQDLLACKISVHPVTNLPV